MEWNERLQFSDNTERKKKIKEKLLMKHKVMFIVDNKENWNHNGDTYSMIPTDLIMIFKDEVTIEEINPIPGGVFHHRIPGGYGKFDSPNFSMK